jgi:MFS family permease
MLKTFYSFAGKLLALRDALLERLFWALCLVGVFAILSSTMAKNPVLNPFAKSLRTPESLLGLVASASTVPGILISLPAGWLSDKIGRRKLLLFSGVIFASAPFVYLFVTCWWQLALARFYHGFATAIFVPVANALIAELFPKRRGERISIFSSATIVGRAAAPFLGGYILSVTNYGFHELYFAVGIAGVTALILLVILVGKPSVSRVHSEVVSSMNFGLIIREWGKVAKNKMIAIVSMVEATQYYAFGAVEFFLVGYLKEVVALNAALIGVIAGAQLVIIPVLKPFMGRLSDIVGREKPIIAGCVISGLSLLAVTLTREFPLLLAISVAYGSGFSLVTASTPPFVADLTGKDIYGTAMGFLSTIMDVGQTLGPIVTGVIIASKFGYSGGFMSLSVIILFTCGVFFLLNVVGESGFKKV